MAEDNNQAAQGGNDTQNQLQFSMQRIYVKDVSFESPNAPSVFQNAFKPKVGLDLNTTSEQVGENLYEVVVKVTAQVTNNEDGATAFLAEVEQAGLFRIAGLSDDQLDHTLGAFCPNMLFPYARECIDNLVNRGSFPPLMLSPVNFEAMYAQKKKRESEAAENVQ
ncbi:MULTISPECIES: protein-export chaperone SecB [Chromohalobacter]|uniref:Protein-export protein SecB n=2 Tax=Chromohalobacter TaxID=42054 RepID=A0A285VBU9_9GAMM|nr:MULTISPECIES: protein-export chaperone SecB [Chromohalobacter]NWO09837.1 protein-export chaperone SecB [Chromohalobacter salexigens]MCK0714783.1 protein-export chaperone SecB [Chromohalobacter sarecensis]MCK0745984.1 protein-export chaperone SecB [Chromohalobacter nigrandesensis]MCT8469016.1 protein-export chaperone SecB [Chromohalobacter canadensis]MCT8472794.1 protein-export chaperone SecB [Chromohalobacter canadensis]